MANQLNGASRTFVVVNPDQCVCGYYALAAGAVSHQMASSAVRRNMPDPVPVLVLARLAVDQKAQGIKLGAALLQDAVNRAVAVSQNADVSAACSCASRARKVFLRALRVSGVAVESARADVARECRLVTGVGAALAAIPMLLAEPFSRPGTLLQNHQHKKRPQKAVFQCRASATAAITCRSARPET